MNEWIKINNNIQLSNDILLKGCEFNKYQTIVCKNNIYISDNYGNTFNNSLILPNFKNIPIDLCISNSGKYQTIITKNEIIYSKNYGKSWYIINSSPNLFDYTNSYFTSLVCSNCGKYQYISTYGGKIWLSNNFGIDWNESNSIIGKWISINISNNKDYKIALNMDDLCMYYLYKNSDVWIKINKEINFNYNYVLCKITKIENEDIYFMIYSYNNVYSYCLNIKNPKEIKEKNHLKTIIFNNKIYNYCFISNKWNVNNLFTDCVCEISSNNKENTTIITLNGIYIKNKKKINKKLMNNVTYIENSLFMRGNNFNLPNNFFIVGKSQIDNLYYYLNINKTTNELIFISTLTPDYTQLPQITLKQNSSSNGTYSFLYENLGLIISEENDYLTIGETTTSSILYFNNIGSLDNSISNYIYPGLWYQLKYNNSQLIWKTLGCENTSEVFCKDNMENLIDKSLDIMFIPINDSTNSNSSNNTPGPNNLSIWSGSSCDSIIGDDFYGIKLFKNYILNNKDAPNNCKGNVKATSSNINCYFTNIEMCTNSYLYDTTIPSESCGKTLGICENSKPCIYDYKTTNLSCSENPTNPETPTNENNFNTTIILVIFLIIIIVIILIFIMVGINKNKINIHA